jgi:hypothetical protein
MIFMRRAKMSEDPIDFSALDPKREPRHFEQMVETVIDGAKALPPSPSFARDLVRWGRTAVALAAALAVTAWLPALVRDAFTEGQRTTGARRDPVELVSAWARAGDVPSGVDVSEALGDLYGR